MKITEIVLDDTDEVTIKTPLGNIGIELDSWDRLWVTIHGINNHKGNPTTIINNHKIYEDNIVQLSVEKRKDL